ncbi:IS630 family transposase [Scytonema tolypothrichoides VB-61278]|nr:IS630 family transposase [Scytonema tolypothrichoides VB-61278]
MLLTLSWELFWDGYGEFRRIFIKSPSGRKRFNVLGALNAITHEIITVTNETYINAESICELLGKLAALKLSIPITIVCDHARYQKCKLVQDLANALEIELLYLPSYSPNLNLIERLWKLVKKQCLYSKYYSDFPEFKTAISSFINTAHKTIMGNGNFKPNSPWRGNFGRLKLLLCGS